MSKNIYVISIEIQHKDFVLGWSNREKYAKKYVEDTLKNRDVLVSTTDEDILDDLDSTILENDKIEKANGFYLTNLEWRIIDHEYQEYSTMIGYSINSFKSFYDLLSLKGKSELQNVMNELQEKSEKDFFKNFINHHSLIHHNGTTKDIMDRLLSRKCYLDGKAMDNEYHAICGFPSWSFL